VSRIFLLPAALALSAVAAAAQAPRSAPKSDSSTVVFVCEHGSVKSVVAVSYFNSEARRRGLPLRAISRGTHPDSAVPGPIRDGLRRDGFEIRAFTPTLFGRADVRGASLLVSFDQDVSPVAGNLLAIERWDGLPALSLDYSVGRDSIRARVAKLVDRLAAERNARGRPKG